MARELAGRGVDVTVCSPGERDDVPRRRRGSAHVAERPRALGLRANGSRAPMTLSMRRGADVRVDRDDAARRGRPRARAVRARRRVRPLRSTAGPTVGDVPPRRRRRRRYDLGRPVIRRLRYGHRRRRGGEPRRPRRPPSRGRACTRGALQRRRARRGGRRGRRRRRRRRRSCSSGATRSARASRCCSRRSASSTSRSVLGARGWTADRGAAATVRAPTRGSSGSGHVDDDGEAVEAARRATCCASRRSAARASGSCRSRGWLRGPPSSRRDIDGYRESTAATRRSSPQATPSRSPMCSAPRSNAPRPTGRSRRRAPTQRVGRCARSSTATSSCTSERRRTSRPGRARASARRARERRGARDDAAVACCDERRPVRRGDLGFGVRRHRRGAREEPARRHPRPAAAARGDRRVRRPRLRGPLSRRARSASGSCILAASFVLGGLIVRGGAPRGPAARRAAVGRAPGAGGHRAARGEPGRGAVQHLRGRAPAAVRRGGPERQPRDGPDRRSVR